MKRIFCVICVVNVTTQPFSYVMIIFLRQEKKLMTPAIEKKNE